MPKPFGTSFSRESRRTEQRNKASQNLDRMNAREIVTLMNREDRRVAFAVEREIPAIARAVDAIVAGVRNGGGGGFYGGGAGGGPGGGGGGGGAAAVWGPPQQNGEGGGEGR